VLDIGATNLDLVRSIYAGWERGDFSSAAWADPEIVFVRPDGPDPGSWKGLARMAEYWRDFLGTWQDFHAEAEEYRELDAERVLVLVRFSGRGKTSGLDIGEMRTMGAGLYHLHGGKVTRGVHYWDRERALADLGLAPDAGAAGSPD
jgi:ketosteroid isomerase-like protein